VNDDLMTVDSRRVGLKRAGLKRIGVVSSKT
jgi:hypothetical protein